MEETLQDFGDTDSQSEEFDDQNDDEFLKLDAENKKKLFKIDSIINDFWSRRVLMSTCINICLVLSALYNGTVFVIAIICTALFHIIDKHLDFKIHRMYQAKDYAKNG